MTTQAEVDRTAMVRTIASQHQSERGALLPILHEVMEEMGYVNRDDMVAIADVLNLSIAEVHGVVSFYKDFRTAPPPAHTITLCRAEACQAVGAVDLETTAQATAASGGYGPDVEVGEVFCLGNCALGPSGTVDGRLHGRLTPERLTALTDGWRG